MAGTHLRSYHPEPSGSRAQGTSPVGSRSKSPNQQAKSQIAPNGPGQPSTAQKSTNWRSGSPPSPGGRKRATSKRSLQPSDAFAGLITMIPQWNQIAQLRSSVVHSQPHVNTGAAGHPAIILESRDSGHVSLVGQMTSWSLPFIDGSGNKHHLTVMEKFPKQQVLRAQHLAISHCGATVPYDSLPVLELANGKNLHYQSYTKLDHFFEIETSLLESLDNNNSYLTQNSFCRLAKHFHDFVTGITKRLPPAPSRPVSPLDCIGVPALSADTMAHVSWGEQLEIIRLRIYITSRGHQTAHWRQQPQRWHSQAVPIAC